MSGRFERALAVVGSVAVVVLGLNGLSYAATGSGLVLGRSNTANIATTVSNTRACPTGKPTAPCAVLNLRTSSTAYPPFTTNAKGLVGNLYAARSANSDRLGGQTLAQVKAASIGPKGAKGDPGPAGTARAYGSVSGTGVLSASSGAVSVSSLATGLVCIELDPAINAHTAALVVTMDYGLDGTNANHLSIGENDGFCGTNGISVVTYLYTLGSATMTPTPEAFYFMVA